MSDTESLADSLSSLSDEDAEFHFSPSVFPKQPVGGSGVTIDSSSTVPSPLPVEAHLSSTAPQPLSSALQHAQTRAREKEALLKKYQTLVQEGVKVALANLSHTRKAYEEAQARVESFGDSTVTVDSNERQEAVTELRCLKRKLRHHMSRFEAVAKFATPLILLSAGYGRAAIRPRPRRPTSCRSAIITRSEQSSNADPLASYSLAQSYSQTAGNMRQSDLQSSMTLERAAPEEPDIHSSLQAIHASINGARRPPDATHVKILSDYFDNLRESLHTAATSRCQSPSLTLSASSHYSSTSTSPATSPTDPASLGRSRSRSVPFAKFEDAATVGADVDEDSKVGHPVLHVSAPDGEWHQVLSYSQVLEGCLLLESALAESQARVVQLTDLVAAKDRELERVAGRPSPSPHKRASDEDDDDEKDPPHHLSWLQRWLFLRGKQGIFTRSNILYCLHLMLAASIVFSKYWSRIFGRWFHWVLKGRHRSSLALAAAAASRNGYLTRGGLRVYNVEIQ